MPNPWLRLWCDMPTDPKWRSIARASKQSIALVQAVYLQVLVAASNADERGRTQVNAEDVGSALDEHTETIQAILDSMQGRVMDGDHVTGWEKRQPKREDSSANRAKEWRERNRTQPNAVERKETPREDTEEIRVDKKEKAASAALQIPTWLPQEDWDAYVEMRKKVKKPLTDRAAVLRLAAWQRKYDEGWDMLAMVHLVIASGWQDMVEEKLVKRKIEWRPAESPEEAWPELYGGAK